MQVHYVVGSPRLKPACNPNQIHQALAPVQSNYFKVRHHRGDFGVILFCHQTDCRVVGEGGAGRRTSKDNVTQGTESQQGDSGSD